jgi:hypothetical protein
MYPVLSRDKPCPAYIKQRDRISCAAVALMNAHLFQGKRVTYKDLAKYRKAVGCPVGEGATITSAAHTYVRNGFELINERDTTVTEILRLGDGVIARLEYGERHPENRIYYRMMGHPVFVGGVMNLGREVRYLFTNITSRGPGHFWMTLQQVFEQYGGMDTHAGVIEVWRVPRYATKAAKSKAKPVLIL